MGYLNNSGLTRFWNAIKSKFIRTINGIGPDTNGNVSVDTCEYIIGTQTAATNAFKGVTHDTAIYSGKHIFYKLPYAGTSTAATLELTYPDNTTTGALPVYYVAGSRLTTHYGAGNIISMTYDATTNAWYCDADRDTDAYAYCLRAYYNIYKTYTNLYRYQVCFTKDNEYILPANAVDNNTGTSKQLTTEEFDPFGEIYWYWTTTTISAGSVPTGTNLVYNYWLVDLRYSFNAGQTLTAKKDVYIVCVPQKNGKVKLADPAITQDLPTTEDGLVYIRFGKAYDTYRVEMGINKPVYHFSNGAIRAWSNSDTGDSMSYEHLMEHRKSKSSTVLFDFEVVKKITGVSVWWNQAINTYNHKSFTNSITDTRTYIQFRFSQQVSPYTSLVELDISTPTCLRKIVRATFSGYVRMVHNGSARNFDFIPYSTYSVIAGHKYLFSMDFLSTDPTNVGGTVSDNLMLCDLTVTFGKEIADHVYSLENSTAGSGFSWLRKHGWFIEKYYVNEDAMSLSTYFDIYSSEGFNLISPNELQFGNIGNDGNPSGTDSHYIRTLYFTKVLPYTEYCLSVNKNSSSKQLQLYVLYYDWDYQLISRNQIRSGSTAESQFATFIPPENCQYFKAFVYGSTTFSTVDEIQISINISDTVRNGRYEDRRYYAKTWYDNPIRLRGLPKLDSDGNMYSDGDVYLSTGLIKRKWNEYTISSSDVTLATDSYENIRYASVNVPSDGLKTLKKEAFHSSFGIGKKGWPFDNSDNIGKLSINASSTVWWFGFSKTVTLAEAQAALDGTKIIYELSSIIEETAEPINGPFPTDPCGVEMLHKSDWNGEPNVAQMDILYASESRANIEMIPVNKNIAANQSAQDLSNCITVKPGTLVPSGTDANTIKTFGEYFLRFVGNSYTVSNLAFNGASKLLVLDMQGSDYDDPMYSGGVMQIQIGEIYDSTTGVRTNKAYSRIYYSGTTWSPWKPIQGGSGLFYGTTATAAATATKDVVCPEFTAVDLVPGTTISVKFDNTNSAAVGSLALNVNGTGAHNVKHVYNGSYSNIPGANYIKAGQLYLFTYDGTYWVVQMMYNTNSVPGLYYYTKKTYTVLNPYMLCLTKDSEYVLPVNTQNTTATTKTMTTEAFDPFGEIYYYAGSSAVSAGGYPNGSLYNSFTYSSVLDLRYSFNTGTTLTARKDVYLVCHPQFSSGKPTGKVMLYTPYVTQTIPVTDQSNPVMGLIYIKIGNAYDTYRIQLDPQKPIYYYDGANIVPWHGFETLQSTDITIANGDKLVVTDASDNDKVARTSIAFDGSTTTQVLSKKGTWVTLPSQQTVPEPATATPLPSITNGAVGTATKYAREDHAHPSDPTKASSTHTHGNITNAGALQTTDITIANGDKLVVTDSDNSGKVARTSIAFDGSTTSQVLSKKGTWVSLPSTPTAADLTDVPQPDAATGDAGTSAKYARADHVHPISVHGIPSGGTTGQFLVKNSNTNYDVGWVTVPNANGVSF